MLRSDNIYSAYVNLASLFKDSRNTHWFIILFILKTRMYAGHMPAAASREFLSGIGLLHNENHVMDIACLAISLACIRIGAGR
jgi:hypothetical protein